MIRLIFLTLVGLGGILASSDQEIMIGDYYRPTGCEVSGCPTADTPFLRSPCPALNTLANHGFIPRNGRNITRAMLKQAIETVFNIDTIIATTLTMAIPETFTLAFLSTHGVIEHDASLAHADSVYGADPAQVDPVLWTDLVDRANGDTLGVWEVAEARKDRLARCQAKPSGCEFGVKEQKLAFGEAALLLLALGGNNDETISIQHAASFFLQEQIPLDWSRSPTPVTAIQLAATSAKILALTTVF